MIAKKNRIRDCDEEGEKNGTGEIPRVKSRDEARK